MGCTPLHFLASQAFPELNDLLLQQPGVDLTLETVLGENVLMKTVSTSNIKLYKRIVSEAENLCSEIDLAAQIRLDSKRNDLVESSSNL